MIKYLFNLLATTLLLYAQSSSDIKNPYPYIEPISVEHAPQIYRTPESKAQNKKEQREEVDLPKDSDNDGIADLLDKCPNTPSDIKVNTQGCEVDTDKDKIVDSLDQCPQTDKEYLVNAEGCPQVKKPNIAFEDGAYKADSLIEEEVEKLAAFLVQNPGYHIVMYVYADEMQDSDANKALSKKRAETLKKEFAKHKELNQIRITLIGMGDASEYRETPYKIGASIDQIAIEIIY